jgi:NADPH2:quinone reductase
VNPGAPARVVRISEFGPPEVLRLAETALDDPGQGQALVAVRSAGVNYMDVSTRQGFNPTVTLPAPLGVEGAGVVEALGAGVEDLHVGQRVAWYYIPGSYADRLIAPAAALVPIPDHLDDDTAAALLMQGLTAQHLAELATPGDTVLVHSAAGGVGSLLTQLLAAADVTVIGRVSSEDKVAAAHQAGASHVVSGRGGHFREEVARLTDGRGVQVVFDSTGADTYPDSLASLATRGLYAYYGGADGQPDPIPLAELPKSVLVTHPVVMDHVATRPDLLHSAGQLFDAVATNRLQLTVGGTYPLDNAAEAHRALQSRTTIGKLLLHPSPR